MIINNNNIILYNNNNFNSNNNNKFICTCYTPKLLWLMAQYLQLAEIAASK